MHDIKSIRDNPQAFDAGLKRRGLAPLSASLLAIDEKRRYFIVIAFIIAAVLTPPDVLSQASLAIPLLVLYEGAIFAVQIVEKKATAPTAASTGAPSAANPAE
jgi:hypothetical protein